LWAIALLAYSNSFRDGLVYDAHLVVTQDPRVRQASTENLGLIFSKDYWFKNSVSSLYRPAATLSYLFNYAILGNGESPAGYHAVNLALHAANIALVYLLGFLLLGEIWPAFAMAALWAVHPVLTEAVTNVVGRADLLAAFGVLAALLCYIRAVTAGGRRAMLWQLGVLASSTLAIFSKESGIVAIAAIFLYDIAWRPTAPLRARIAGYLAATLPIVVFLTMRADVLKGIPLAPIPFTDNPVVGGDFFNGHLTAVKVLGKYLWILLWPASLSCDYSYGQIPLFSGTFRSWEDWQSIVALAIYVAAAVWAVRSLRRAKVVFFLIAFFFATISPTANIFLPIGTIMAERTLYLPSIAAAGLVVWAAWNAYRRFLPRWPMLGAAAPAALAIVCLALATRTFARNFDWYDEQALWTSAAETVPDSYRPHEHLASSLASPPRRDFDRAAHEAERAIAILQPLPDVEKVAATYATAGFCYRVKGDSLGRDGGAQWYRKALAVLLEGKRVDEAWDREFQRQNRLAGKVAGPSHVPQLYLELGRTYRALAQYQDALGAFSSDVWTEPQAQYYEEISQTYRDMGDSAQAAVSLLEGIALGVPDQNRLAIEVVELYKQTAPESCALAGSGAALAINFNCPLVREHLCLASRNVARFYHRMHHDKDAAATTSGAIRGLGCPAEMFR
ncbi:MAG: DUF1736 domain-containing protein, partial [Ignavibacteriota bacterium]